MQKKFLSNLVITLGVNLLVKPLWILGIDRTFQNRLGLEQYGIYTNLFTFSLILGLLLDFGINNYNSSSLAHNPGRLQRQFVPLLALKALLGIGYLVLTLLFGVLYGFGVHELYLLLILSLNQCMAYASTYFRSTLTGLQLYRTDAYISAVDRLTMLIGGTAMLFLWTTDISIDGFVYVQSVGYLTAMIVSFGALLPRLRAIQFTVQWEQVKPVFYKSLPFALLVLLMMLYTRLDILLIKKLAPQGDTENGIYAQSTRLLEAVNMMAVLVSGLLLPMFSSIIKKRQSLTPMVKLAMLVLLIPAIMGVVYCYVYGAELMELLYSENDDYHVSVFRLCISSILPLSVMYVFGTLVTAKGKMEILIRIAFVGLVFNVAANLYVIPRYGAQGAALVALITHSIIAAANTYVALTHLPLSMNVVHLLKFPVFGFLCFAGLLFVKSRELFVTPVLLIGYVFVAGVFTLVLQIMDADTLKRAFKRLRE
ncbi:MAG: oligosaccharide flippase family protein [Bacteroidota bacterium]